MLTDELGNKLTIEEIEKDPTKTGKTLALSNPL